MNRWLIWALAVGGLLVFLYLQPEPQPVPATSPSARALPRERGAIPYDPPPAKVATPKPVPTFQGYPCDGDC